MEEKGTELLNALESLLVDVLVKTIPNIDKVGATNILGKIGARIVFGRETADSVYFKSKSESVKE